MDMDTSIVQANLRPRGILINSSQNGLNSETEGIIIHGGKIGSPQNDSLSRCCENLLEEKISNVKEPLSTSPSLSIPPLLFDTTDFECSLCFRLFYKPVSTPCGHTYCRFSCPLCRAKLESPLKYNYSINVVLLNLLEKHFKKEYEERRLESEEEESNLDLEVPEPKPKEMGFTSNIFCFIPPMSTCGVLLPS